MKVLLYIVFIFCSVGICFAQFNPDTIDFKSGKYRLKAIYIDSLYGSSFVVTKDKKEVFGNNAPIFKAMYEEKIDDIKECDFNNDGNKTILIAFYSGGAHCCISLHAARIMNDKFEFTDTLFLGNSYYDLEKLDNNGIYKITAANDMFAYAFTNYAENKAPLMIYTVENGKFKWVSSQYRGLVEKQIAGFREDLKGFKDFKCEPEDEETFNTDAGSVKTILAAITADYSMIGELQKGYDLIDSVYNCPDKEKFITILKEDYKLK